MSSWSKGALGALAGLLALSFLVFGGSASAADSTIPTMTIQIFNTPSSGSNIYPVISAGAASAFDSWMQAFFQLTNDQVSSGNYPYPRAGISRFYINCCAAGENGIPPGGSVTVTLPLFSPLVANIDPTSQTPPGQFADWWQGGHIEVFENAASAGQPPQALADDYNAENTVLPIYSGPPTCTGCSLHFFFDTASIPNSAPQQLLEYTLGANPVNPRNAEANQPHFLFDATNVDYDVSYVNNAYLPAVMEPYGNMLIGWIGAANSIDDFTAGIDKFLNAPDYGAGWPVYAGTSKIASALEIFLNYNATNLFNPAPAQSQPIMTMENLWEACVTGKSTDTICPGIVDVTNLLYENFDNYRNNFHTETTWNCSGTPEGPSQGPPPETVLLGHMYGWAPFNYGCAADANLLQDTPGYNNPQLAINYASVKKEYDDLQYWKNFPVTGIYGLFDPYVGLIHGSKYIDAPYTYAYSVDDAVGNMQTDGTGLIIEIGGTGQLPNPDHATPNVNIAYGYSSPGYGINFVEYGRCSDPNTPTNPDFASFAVPLGIDGTSSSIINCKITFLDSKNRNYQFKIKSPPPWGTDRNGDNAERALIDCAGNTGQVLNWCQDVYAWQETLSDAHQTIVYHVTAGGPPPLGN